MIQKRAAVGRTPCEQIRHRHMESVRDLLTETDQSLRQIAAHGRFSCIQNLDRAVRAAYGTSSRPRCRSHSARRSTSS